MPPCYEDQLCNDEPVPVLPLLYAANANANARQCQTLPWQALWRERHSCSPEMRRSTWVVSHAVAGLESLDALPTLSLLSSHGFLEGTQLW